MHHSNLFFFIICASLAITVFLLALIELYFTKRRHRAESSLHEQLKAIKASYNEAINRVVLEESAKQDSEDSVSAADVATKQKEELARLQSEFAEKLATAEHSQDKALAKAKLRAKELEAQAHQKADEYLASRQQEVEADLMNLVMHVTKKVLPQTLTYDIHKELVLQALREVDVAKTER